MLLTIKPINKPNLNFEYHYKLQGFIYSLLRNTSFENLHDKRDFKFFCFSNIFQNIKKPTYYHVIISSPIELLITQITYQLQKLINSQIPIEVDTFYDIISVKIINQSNLKFPLKIITASPIILRMPIDVLLNTSVHTAPYKYVYWRATHPISLFVNGIQKNLKKKFTEFSGTSPKIRFENYIFKKQVSTKLKINNSTTTIIGTLWEFNFSQDTPKEIQMFILDCGIGERNSLGFGFINSIQEKPKQKMELM